MSSPALVRLQNKLQAARKSTARAREKAGELMESALETGLASGAALALGVMSKKAPGAFKDMAFGVPAPLAIGIGAHAAALMGVGRGMEKHFRSVGNGAIAAHMFNVGQDMATGGGGGLLSRATSAAPIQGEGVSTADLVSLARG